MAVQYQDVFETHVFEAPEGITTITEEKEKVS